jgi:hypothetical protein
MPRTLLLLLLLFALPLLLLLPLALPLLLLLLLALPLLLLLLLALPLLLLLLLALPLLLLLLPLPLLLLLCSWAVLSSSQELRGQVVCQLLCFCMSQGRNTAAVSDNCKRQ